MVNKSGAAASKKASADADSVGRIKQIRMVAKIIRRANPKAMPIVFGIAIVTIALFVVLGLVTGITFLIGLGVPLGLIGAMIAFGRFAQAAQYSTIEGQPGAAAAVLQGMRGNWTVTPAIAANKTMDVVHRAVGKPGVILIGEGSPNRLPRVALDVPIYDLQVGNEPGQIVLRKMQRHIMKLPRNLKGPAIADLNYRLKALPQTLQMPKGPMPRQARMPKAPRPKFR
jgi:hypothetical protein